MTRSTVESNTETIEIVERISQHVTFLRATIEEQGQYIETLQNIIKINSDQLLDLTIRFNDYQEKIDELLPNLDKKDIKPNKFW